MPHKSTKRYKKKKQHTISIHFIYIHPESRLKSQQINKDFDFHLFKRTELTQKNYERVEKIYFRV